MTKINAMFDRLRMPFTQPQLAALENFVVLLCKWNKTYNLVSTHNVKEIIIKHLIDSLAIHEYVQGRRIIDVGTGAGFPGIPLAIVQSQRQFVLLDSNGKKISFIKQAIAELNLPNVSAIQMRAEAFSPDACFDSVLTRAFASICAMLKATQHLACADGCFLAMKGKQPTTELQTLPSGFRVEVMHTLQVPQLEAARCLVIIKRETRQ